jgi:hypothetical protein
MTRQSCVREQEIVALVVSGQWPDGCDEEVRMHAEHCEICREVALIAPLLRDDFIDARAGVSIPAAGQVWWRAAVRARMEATHAAARPITWAQGLAGAAAAGILVALIGVAWPSLAGAVVWIAVAVGHVDPAGAPAATMLVTLLQRSLPAMIAIALCAVVAPVAVYLALSGD